MVELTSISFGIALFGGVYDLLTRRIPNWLTFPSIVLGFAAQFYSAGLPGGETSALGIATGFALFFPVYFLKIMGAGDVKLLMVMGAWGGPQFCLRVAVGSVVLGGIYALLEVIFVGRLLAVWRAAYRYFRSLLWPELAAESLALDKQRKFSFGIAIAVAAACIIALEHRGQLL